MRAVTVVLVALNSIVIALASWWLWTYRPKAYKWALEAWMVRLCAFVPLFWAARALGRSPDVCETTSIPLLCMVGELVGPIVSIVFLVSIYRVRKRFSKKQ